MRPPWITFYFTLIQLIMASSLAVGKDEGEERNSTTLRSQREINERERRLIPYMTYYVTQSLTSPGVGTRQNVFVPVTSPRENPYNIDTVPKISLNNIQNVNPQGLELLPKPVLGIPSPSFSTPTIQVNGYKMRDGGVLPQIYRLEAPVVRPLNQLQAQSQTQPLQIIKLSPVPVEQKFSRPQVTKVIPFLTKVPLENAPLKSFVPGPQLAYVKLKEQTFAPASQNYYNNPIPLQNEPPHQDNKLYASVLSGGNSRFRLIGSAPRPETNDKYSVAKIVVSTTTPTPIPIPTSTPYASEDGNREQVLISTLDQLSGAVPERARLPPTTATSGTYVTAIPGQQQVYYIRKPTTGHNQNPPTIVAQNQEETRVPRLRVPEEEKIRFVATVTPVQVTNDLESHYERTKGDRITNNLFSLLQETNKLPQNLTPDNIDTGIKTLALILDRLQKQRITNPPSEVPPPVTSVPELPTVTAKKVHKNPTKVHSFPEKSGTSTPGRPGVDYPIYSSIPPTNFDCSTQRYKGFFGDPDTKCQVWHYCDLNGGQASFLCPNGTIFSQVALTCDWWFNVKCASTSQLYVLNERLYKYILPFSPSFPEDFSGPVVDTYLEAKFKEMESKSKSKALKSPSNSTTTSKPEITTEIDLSTEKVDEYRDFSTIE